MAPKQSYRTFTGVISDDFCMEALYDTKTKVWTLACALGGTEKAKSPRVAYRRLFTKVANTMLKPFEKAAQ